ncbi:nuclear receptor coactivator 6-like isoform X1 [Wyeomyia smithii]|uniref:nuclear receptor coactivator 6-like isoform X1 n=1 Tax=Wyeomyia smithii TaxID=174621 RepID=UPI002467F8CD|nr:nuclear receptor coactivator 6-like isoform X1 [Wyeomyia smithii]
MKDAWRIFLLLMILNPTRLTRAEPQYQQQLQQQQQQTQLQSQANYINNNLNYNNYNNGQQPQLQQPQQASQQQLQQQQQYQQQQPQQFQQPTQRPYRYRSPTTTAAPSFLERISSWFNFFGDDEDRRQPPPPPPRQPSPSNAPPPPLPVPAAPLPLQPQQPQQQQQQQVVFPNQPYNQAPQALNDQLQSGNRSPLLSTSYGPPNFVNPQPTGGFLPMQNSNVNIQGSGTSYHAVANSYQASNVINGNFNNNVAAQAPANQYQPQPQQFSHLPSTLQQQQQHQQQQKIIGAQQDPRILKPSQPVSQVKPYRDPEPTTPFPEVAPAPPGVDHEFDYHPCNKLSWVPMAAPPGHFPGTQVPPISIPQNTILPPRPIKLEVRPKGQVHSVASYPPAGANGSQDPPPIVTAPPQAQQLIQLQLQQQQQQLQTLQLQQIQFQQQQLQQQLQQLKVSTTPHPPIPTQQPSADPFVQSAAPAVAHFVTRKPNPPPSAAPITFRQVSASYFTNKDYNPPAKILPIQNEDKPHAPITLPNLSASPVPPLYTATSFHTDPYKFYRPYRPRDTILELGYGYPQSQKSMSDSYTRYNQQSDVSGNRNRNSIFDVEQVASSSSAVYTTVAYTSEDSKPAASELLRNVDYSNGTNDLVDEDEDYESEEDSLITGVTVTYPVEVTSAVPKTRYYSSRTTTTEKPTTFPSPLNPPSGSDELGNGLQIIYSANLQTTSPPTQSARQQTTDAHSSHLDAHPQISHFNNLLNEDDDSPPKQTLPITFSTRAPPTKPVSVLTTFKVGTQAPTRFQRYTTDTSFTEYTTPVPITITTVPPVSSPRSTSLTAAIGGYKNITSTKKPKQIQIIIPYSTYKKPEPFKSKEPKRLTDSFPEESNLVTVSSTVTTTLPPKSRFVTREFMKYFQSTSNIKDILRKETTKPFSRPPTSVPEKPLKTKKVEPVKVSKDSKPFTLRIPKMTPMPPVFNLTGMVVEHDVDHKVDHSTTPPPTRTFRPTITMAHPSKFTPHYVNTSRIRPYPTSQAHAPRTTIAQLLRTTKIVTKPQNSYDEPEYITRPLPPIVYRRTTVPTTTSTQPETTPFPIYERSESDIDPLLLQRRIDTWTEQQFSSDDYIRKSSTIPLHRVTKAIPWEFLTSTMLPSLRDRTKGRDYWRNVKIAISPHTKEKVYVVTPQPWTVIINRQTFSSPSPAPPAPSSLSTRFSIRPTPLNQQRADAFASGIVRPSGISTGSTVDVSPESVNDLVEHKSKHRSSLLSAAAKLKQRKYVRKKTFNGGGSPASVPSSLSSDESSGEAAV